MITEDFIKQCEKAGETQKAWKPKAGNYILLETNRQIYLISSIEQAQNKKIVIFYSNINNGNDSWCYEEFFKKNFTWLPTQEQLQEMMGIKNGVDFEGFIVDICIIPYGMEFNGLEDYYKKSNSVNELMLKYVMKEKYNKVWNGEDWIKEDSNG